jgi:lysophospholipase L1-like esterase
MAVLMYNGQPIASTKYGEMLQTMRDVDGVLKGDGTGNYAEASAIDLEYNNTESGLAATNTQDAIDEIDTQLNEKANLTYLSDKKSGNVVSIETYANRKVKLTTSSSNSLEKISISGKNLFDKNNYSEKNLFSYLPDMVMKVGNVGEDYGTIYIPIVGGLQYTVSKMAGKSFRVSTSSVIPNPESLINFSVANHQGESLTINTASADKYLIVTYYVNTLDTIDKTVLRNSLQIELGSIKNSLETYKGYAIISKNGRGTVEVSAMEGETVIAGNTNIEVEYGYDSELRMFKGKKWLFIGDSITEHNFRATKNYDEYLAELFEIESLNYGVSSSGYMNNYLVSSGWYTRLTGNLYPTDVDGIVIMGALNDRHNPVGTYGDSTTATLYGTLKLFFEELITRYPNIPIVTVTSTPRDYSYGDTATKSGYQNYSAWVDAVKRMSADYSIPCFDLYRLSGLRPWNTANNLKYFSCPSAPNGDGVHPNELGQEVIAYKLYDFLKQHMYK